MMTMYGSTYTANQYRSQSVATSPQQLVLMCYDGIVMFLGRVRGHIESRNIEQKMKFLNKAMAILEELQGSLDFQKGGEIAVNLDRLYDYFIRELVNVGRNDDVKTLDHIVKLTKELRSAWEKVVQETPATPPAPSDSSGGIVVTG